MNFKQKVLKIVSKIPAGSFSSYKKVAKKAGNENASRIVGQILARNKNPKIPCHRVILSNNLVGGYQGKINLAWKKAAILLKEGVIGVIPTDTIYGICTSAFQKNSVEKIYQLRRRNPKKPCIILISSLRDLEEFDIKLKKEQKEFLTKIWPAKISVILKCKSKKFFYLERGTKTLAFRLPKNKFILKILKISGPLVAPSCNIEGKKPAENIKEAKKYFKDRVFYLDKGKIKQKPSTLIDLTKVPFKIIRKGADFRKLKINDRSNL